MVAIERYIDSETGMPGALTLSSLLGQICALQVSGKPCDLEYELVKTTLARTEKTLNTYLYSQGPDTIGPTKDQLRELHDVLSVCQAKDLRFTDETAAQARSLLEAASPVFIAVLRRDIERLAILALEASDITDPKGHKTQGLSQQQLVLIVLIWIAAIWLPVMAMGLPDKDQALFADWVGTTSLALTLVTMVTKTRQQGSPAARAYNPLHSQPPTPLANCQSRRVTLHVDSSPHDTGALIAAFENLERPLNII